MDAAVPVDAQNAPTATWKTAQNTVSHSAHTHHRVSIRKKTERATRLTHEIPDTPDVEKIDILQRSVACISFNNVADGREGCAAELRSQAIPFVPRKISCFVVDSNRERVSCLKHSESSMISRHALPRARNSQTRDQTRKPQRPKTKDQRPKTKAQSPKPVVGIIGLGIMGSAMAANTVRAGYTVIGYDVDATRVRDHVRAGGVAARRSADVRKRSDIVICSLPAAAALAQVAAELADSDGAEVVIETSTMPIAVKVAAQQRLAEVGVTLLDCPLSGTGSQAKVRDIVVYASGAESAYRRVAPVMDAFARAHYYVGAFGAGSKTKFVANLLVAIHNVAAAEGLVLAMKAGLDPALTLKVIADGGGSSRMLQVRGPMMVRGDYSSPTMKLDVWQKDMNAIAEFAREVGCPTPLFAATAPIYLAAMAAGRGGEDTGAVCAVLEEMASFNRPSASRRRGGKAAASRQGIA